jgi:hypothetical protein
MNTKKTQSGFAMLFTVLVVSIVLSLAVGISSITFKQSLLSSIAKDSQVAFFTADSGLECGLLWDLIPKTGGGFHFPRGTTPSTVTLTSFSCSTMQFSFSASESYTNYIVFRENVSNQNNPCRTIVFNKTGVTENKVQARGYNICKSSPRQVERALEAKYI